MAETVEPIAPYRPIPDDEEFIDIIRNGSMYAEVTAFERLVATIGVEQAYRRWTRFQHQGTTHELQEEVDRLIGELAKADKRAEQAEAALAELRERLGETGEQWGVRGGGGTFAVLDEDEARWHMFDSLQPMTPVTRVVGEWRDAAPRTALERATDEQDVQSETEDHGLTEFGRRCVNDKRKGGGDE